MTPMQVQYENLKSRFPNHILLFRLGDFYEAFDEDAEVLSAILGITLTGRGKEENRRKMAGIPFHALPNYLPKLIESGKKVAVADQTEEARPGKLVERKVTQIITPGTVMDPDSLQINKNNYIASLYLEDEIFGLVFCELTTGELRGFSSKKIGVILDEIEKFSPSEILIPENLEIEDSLGNIERLEDSKFKFENAVGIVKLIS